MPYKNDKNHSRLLLRIIAGSPVEEMKLISDKCKTQSASPRVKVSKNDVNFFIKAVSSLRPEELNLDASSAEHCYSALRGHFAMPLAHLRGELKTSKRMSHLRSREGGHLCTRQAIMAAQVGFTAKTAQFLTNDYVTLSPAELGSFTGLSSHEIEGYKIPLFYKYGRDVATAYMMEIIDRLQSGKGLLC